jgi:hypothetical protein
MLIPLFPPVQAAVNRRVLITKRIQIVQSLLMKVTKDQLAKSLAS